MNSMLNEKFSIVIDLQIFQANFKKNHANHDTIAIINTIAKCADVELTILLNGLFKEDIPDIRKLLLDNIPALSIRTWFSPNLLSELPMHRNISALIREEVLLSLNPGLIILPGAFDYIEPRIIIDSDIAPILAREKVLIALGLEAESYSTSFESLTGSTVTNDELLNAILGFCNETMSSSITSDFLGVYDNRPKLAFVSPLPPLKSGISFYSSDLIVELSKYYDIDIITDQENIIDGWITSNYRVLTPNQFLERKNSYKRIMYQMGNSPMHAYIYDLMVEAPGLVVLHDLYLGDLIYYMGGDSVRACYFGNKIYESHGYQALLDFENSNIHHVLARYPISSDVFSSAKGVVLHSNYAKVVANSCYPELAKNLCFDVPLFRAGGESITKSKARKELQLNDDDIIVTSFGHIGPSKLNHCAIRAWLASSLHENKNCKLIFVGENNFNGYSSTIQAIVDKSKNISITGWVDDKTYKNYLAASDIAIQLRSESRGETSAAVLDCMNYGVATIVNANGSMAELDPNGVLILPHEIESDELLDNLTSAIENLASSSSLRDKFANNASDIVVQKHSLTECALKYVNAIEATKHNKPNITEPVALLERITSLDFPVLSGNELMELTQCISDSFPAKFVKKRLFIDVTIVADNDLRTGIQRVVRSIVIELINRELDGYSVEPVFLSDIGDRWHYRYARTWTAKTLGLSVDWLRDEAIDFKMGDQLLILDFTSAMLTAAVNAGCFERIRNKGVTVNTVIYDLLPIQFPNYFPDDIDLNHKCWMDSVLKLDGAICISEAVAKEAKAFVREREYFNSDSFPISWFHLGADIDNSSSTSGLPSGADQMLQSINDNITFLMVGTIEPRKGNAQVVAAFKQLWREGVDINLVLVGKSGWMTDEFIKSIRSDSQFDKKLYWLSGISDEYLEKVYESSSCLIAASEGEGFGLPLIEAAQHNIPIIAREIPVFREVAGEHAFYFDSNKAEHLAHSIKQWLTMYANNQHPKSELLPWLTWRDSADKLLKCLGI